MVEASEEVEDDALCPSLKVVFLEGVGEEVFLADLVLVCVNVSGGRSSPESVSLISVCLVILSTFIKIGLRVPDFPAFRT